MTNGNTGMNPAGQGTDAAETEPKPDYVNPTLRSLAESFPDSEHEGPDFDAEDSGQ